jgi:hypothetical protein
VGVDEEVVALVDIPSFDKGDDSDAMVFAELCRFFLTQHLLGISLKGIMFLHDVDIVRSTCHDQRFLETLRRVCGDNAYPNVALVTTLWNQDNLDMKYERDATLQCEPWSELLATCANVYEYDISSDIAQTIVSSMLTKEIVLRIQKELTGDCEMIESTTADAELASQLDRKLGARQMEIQSLSEELGGAIQTPNITVVRKLQTQLKLERQE